MRLVDLLDIMSRMLLRRLLVLPLLVAMAWAADYQVVLKPSGKIIHGDFVSEDANTVTLKVNRAEVSFKKDRLDLTRMQELNQSQRAAGLPAGSTAPDGATGSAAGDGKQLIHELERGIAERKLALANNESRPASDERDRRIQETEAELRKMRKALVDLQLKYGVSGDPELEQLWNQREEAFAQAEEAKQAYDDLPENASKAEWDARWERFRNSEKRWHEAQDAYTKALQQER
jgi:hypothetical protein